jgi:hypothetical protein
MFAGKICRQFGTVRLKLHCQLQFGELLDTERFKQEKRLAAGNGIG